MGKSFGLFNSREKAGLVIFRESQRNWIIPVTRRDTDNHFGCPLLCDGARVSMVENRVYCNIRVYNNCFYQCEPEYGRKCDSI